MNHRYRDELDTPIGRLALVADDAGRLCAAGFLEGHKRAQPGLGLDAAPTVDPFGLSRRFQAYFSGDLRALAEIETDLAGTPFQRHVWAALRQIPLGKTWSYGQLARQLGRPKAARAVGSANGANPTAIVVPCHRVIGADGSLTGYAAGVSRKVWLLAHEGVSGRW